MRQLLLFVLMLGVLGFVTDHADAKQITVQLTKNQVNTVCDGKDYCQKACGSEKQYNCEFGCGKKGLRRNVSNLPDWAGAPSAV